MKMPDFSLTYPQFTPWSAFCGGSLIAASALLFLVVAGKRVGISGLISAGLLSSLRLQPLDPLATSFLSAFLVAALAAPSIFNPPPPPLLLPPTAYVLSGLLVGFGTRLGNGCTSGHGVCGLSRLSKRGAVAVITFMSVGVVIASFLGAHPHPFFRVAPPPPPASSDALDLPIPPAFWTPSVLLLAVFLLLYRLGQKTSFHPCLHLAALFSGALFALGLALSGMSQSLKVLDFLFLRFPGWDPSLVIVLGAAVGLLTPFSLYILSHQAVAYGDPTVKIYTPGKGPLATSQSEKVDWRLLVGEAIFGAGWGITGICPGPALVLLAQGHRKVALLFWPMYVGGYLLEEALERVLTRRKEDAGKTE